MSYKHLRPEERYYIEIELKKGTSQNEIADSLGRNQSRISREVFRNTGQRGYRNKQAFKCPHIRYMCCPDLIMLCYLATNEVGWL